MLQDDQEYLNYYSSLQYDLFAETFGASSNRRFAIALKIPFMKGESKQKQDYIVNFLKEMQAFLSSSYDYESIKSFMSNYKKIKFILWIKQPPKKCNGKNNNHINCTLSDCYEKCYHSIVPNGSCGFQLEYIFLKRFLLPINERDNLNNDNINVNSENFLPEFTKHVAKVINEPNRITHNHTVLRDKYTKFQKWLQKNNTSNDNFQKKSMYPEQLNGNTLWLADFDWAELKYNDSNKDIHYTFFEERPDEDIPYIPFYYLCMHNAQTLGRYFYFQIENIEEFLTDPNLGVLSMKHYFLVSSNKSFLPELKEGVLEQFAIYKRIFDLNAVEKMMSIEEAKQGIFKSNTFCKFGKKKNDKNVPTTPNYTEGNVKNSHSK